MRNNSMKNILTFFNSVQTLIGLFFTALSVGSVYGCIMLLQSDEPLVLRISGFLIICFACFFMFAKAVECFRKGFDITQHYTIQERDAKGDLLIGRY